jgi:hypothetical protein
VPQSIELSKEKPVNLTILTYLKPTTFTKWTWSTGPTFTHTQPIGIFCINTRARIPGRHTEIKTKKVQGIKPEEKKNNYKKEEEDNYVHKECCPIDGKRTCARLAMADKRSYRTVT